MVKHCAKCGLPLGFKRLKSGKWCPTNPDGSDHWDLCRETALAAMTPEERAWKVYKDAQAARPVVTGKHIKTYKGDVPPWDESLGEFQPEVKREKRR
jgi:uncharacterized protein YifE (UPF0438 family)